MFYDINHLHTFITNAINMTSSRFSQLLSSIHVLHFHDHLFQSEHIGAWMKVFYVNVITLRSQFI